MRRAILCWLVTVCALAAHPHPAASQSAPYGRMGQAGAPAGRSGHTPSTGHHHLPPAVQQPSGHGHGGGATWRPPAATQSFSHHHGTSGFTGRGGGPRFYGGFNVGGLGFGVSAFSYRPGPRLYGGGYYYGPEGILPLHGGYDYGYGYGIVPPEPYPYGYRPATPWFEPAPYGPPPYAGAAPPVDPRWDQPLGVEPLGGNDPVPVAESTPAAKLRSIRSQANGDMWLRRGEYHNARDRYKSAVDTAPDRPEPWFRLAVVHAALGSYPQAVRALRTGLELDPSWPVTAEPLDDLFGPENRVAKLSVISRVSSWLQEDLRDPERLFLMGVLLHWNGDHDRARPFFEAAWQFGGPAEHVGVFLNPVQPPAEQPADAQPPDAPAAEPQQPANPTDVFVPPLPDEPVPSTTPSTEPKPPADGPMLPPLPTRD